jgi:hypothetical protein
VDGGSGRGTGDKEAPGDGTPDSGSAKGAVVAGPEAAKPDPKLPKKGDGKAEVETAVLTLEEETFARKLVAKRGYLEAIAQLKKDFEFGALKKSAYLVQTADLEIKIVEVNERLIREIIKAFWGETLSDK